MVCCIREYTLSILRVVAFRAEIGYKGMLVDMWPATVVSPGNGCATLYRKATHTLCADWRTQVAVAAGSRGSVEHYQGTAQYYRNYVTH